MIISKKRINWIIKLGLLFVAILFVGVSLYADANDIMENEAINELKISSNASDCSEITTETKTG